MITGKGSFLEIRWLTNMIAGCLLVAKLFRFKDAELPRLGSQRRRWEPARPAKLKSLRHARMTGATALNIALKL